MDEVLDEVANDGVKHSHQYDDSDEQVESVGGQVDGVPRGGYVALEEHRPVLLSVKNIGAVTGCIHHWPSVLKTAAAGRGGGILLKACCHSRPNTPAQRR